jgi:hypothetical protein
MIARGAGDVGCAHCKQIGAGASCQVCTRLVCAACAADWATCSEPSGRVVRLGVSARLRDVDPGGRVGMVSRWRGPLRLFDLRRLRWVKGESIERELWTWRRAFPPRLTDDGRLIYPALSRIDLDTFRFDGIHARWLGSRQTVRYGGERPAYGTAVSASGDRYWYVTDTQQVVVLVPGQRLPPALSAVSLPSTGEAVPTQVWTFEPLPRKVVQAVHVDGERDLLAAGTWGEIVLSQFRDGRLHRLDRIETEGDLVWVAVTGRCLAAAVRVGGVIVVRVWELARSFAIGAEICRQVGGRLYDASLSRDGRYLATGLDRSVVVHALDAGTSVTFDDHTDRLGLIRFVGDDHLLVTADHDNRMIQRPRTAHGYASALLKVDVPDGDADRVELPRFVRDRSAYPTRP